MEERMNGKNLQLLVKTSKFNAIYEEVYAAEISINTTVLKEISTKYAVTADLPYDQRVFLNTLMLFACFSYPRKVC